MGWIRALAASVLMGAGIASMHYIGMAAMRLSAVCRYKSSLVVLSVVFRDSDFSRCAMGLPFTSEMRNWDWLEKVRREPP